jgi:hypothetical protein
MNAQTSAAASTWTTTSHADLLEALTALESRKPATEWVLISPDGRMWKTEDVRELFAVLAPHHPLLKLPASDFVKARP